MIPINLLIAPYQLDHLQEVLTVYRMAITKKLEEPFKSKSMRRKLHDKLLLTDEIADGINMLEGESCCDH